MNSVDLLEEAIQIAMNSGYEVRQEWLEERGGGACRIGARKMMFVDLSLPAQDQLNQTVEALRSDPHTEINALVSQELKSLLEQ